MSLLSRASRILGRVFGRQEDDRDLDTEIDSYLETIVDRRIKQGVSREEAVRQARLEFGGREQIKEQVRDVRVGSGVETTIRDLQYAARSLRKNPGFALTAILTLGLAIGANSAIFSLINALMLRVLPVGHPEQLVLLSDPGESSVAVDTTEHGVRGNYSYEEFQRLREQKSVFSGMLAAQNAVSDVDVVLDHSGSEHEKARAQLVSGSFFDTLEVRPILGRVFSAEDETSPGANRVAVLSYGFWKRAFAGNLAVLGSAVKVGQGIFHVVGIAPPEFRGILVGSDTDIWFPITMQAQVLPGRDYLRPIDTLWLHVMARLAPGVTMAQAETAVNLTFQHSLREWADRQTDAHQRREVLNEHIQLRPAASGASSLRGRFRDPLLLLFSMVGVVLLIASANLANLLLTRAVSRRREIGVRLALGASRQRVVRQLIAESALLAIFGGAVGLVLSTVGARALLWLVASGVDGVSLNAPPDLRVIAFTGGLSLLTLLLFGLAPAIRGTRLDVQQSLAANTRSAAGESGKFQTGRILSVAQVTLSIVLLTATALLVRGLSDLLQRNLGFASERLLLIRLDPTAAGYRDSAATALSEKIRLRFAALPGVRAVTLSNTGLFGGDSGDHISLDGSSIHNPDELTSTWTEVGADYFKTLGVPLLRGREIDSSDVQKATPVCLVNEAFAKRFFPDASPIGHHLTDEYPTTRETFEIVGVVPNLKEHGPNQRLFPRFYSNIAHPIGALNGVTFLLRTVRAPVRTSSDIRAALHAIDPNLSIVSLRSFSEQIDRSLFAQRMVVDLAEFFAILALLVAAIGLYGVISFSMTRRTNEIGIRMALGASAASVRNMVLKEALVIAGIGAALGIPCALLSARVLANRFYSVNTLEPFSISAALVAMFAVAILAAYLPARRASRIDPMMALRNE